MLRKARRPTLDPRQLRFLTRSLAPAAVCATALALLPSMLAAAPAPPFTATDVTIAADDGVSLAGTLVEPGGTPPARGWPAIIMFHGLGGSRQDMIRLGEGFLVNTGYAILALDARGFNGSGGTSTLDGARETSDARDAFNWLAAQREINSSEIGGFGISLGGGAVLEAAVKGVPFSAIVAVATWSNLATALAPNRFPKTKEITALLREMATGRIKPTILRTLRQASRGQIRRKFRRLTSSRSTLSHLSSLRTPVFLVQGRGDFLFGVEQAINAFQRINAPKRLYIGNLGHFPATNPPDEAVHYLRESRLWFDRFVRGVRNGIDFVSPIELAESYPALVATYRSLPREQGDYYRSTQRHDLRSGGPDASFHWSVSTPLNILGAPTVNVQLSSVRRFPRLIATLIAITPAGTRTVLGEGGVRLHSGRQTRRTIQLNLSGTLATVAAGSVLRLIVGPSASAAKGESIYLAGAVAAGAKVIIRSARLALPVIAPAKG